MSGELRIRSKLHPSGRAYEVARIPDLPREDLEQIVGIRRRLLKRRLRPARVSAALAATVAIILPGLEPEVAAALDDEQRCQVIDLAEELSCREN